MAPKAPPPRPTVHTKHAETAHDVLQIAAGIVSSAVAGNPAGFNVNGDFKM